MNTEKLCRLAGLTLKDDERAQTETSLRSLIRAADKLSEADCSGIENESDPFFCPLREDVPEESANLAPVGGYFTVGKIIS